LFCFECRYDKIKSYEAKAAAGNILNEEQQALIISKPSIEKSLQDIESVKIQIQEIANEVFTIIVHFPLYLDRISYVVIVGDKQPETYRDHD
jgi:hypothetical protein